MDPKKTYSGPLTLFLILCIFILPTIVAMSVYHEERFTTRIEDRIPAEPVKSITNQFSETVAFGGAGGLASTEIRTSSVEQFLNQTAGEKVYSAIVFSGGMGEGAYNPGPSVLEKTYASLIKDRSGVYTYVERYEYSGYTIEDFYDGTIHWYHNNRDICFFVWLGGFVVMLFVSLKAWKEFKRRGWVKSIC